MQTPIQPASGARGLRRALRFICIMGQTSNSDGPDKQSASLELVRMGLIDETGRITPKGREFMKDSA